MKRLFLSFALLAGGLLGAQAEVDPNFYIYLCFGQSNMEGNASWESMDNTVDDRFKMLATCNFDNPKRTMGNWYTAKCPIVSPMGKLGPSDYFGRTMVAALPKDVKVGVVAVAMGGSPIEAFYKDTGKNLIAQKSGEWWAQLANWYYAGDPYKRLVEMAKKAQEVGVIKGILLHQGCSNNGDSNWPNMVKKIYDDILKDLNLNGDTIPLFVGETERQNMGGSCYAHNTVVAKVPNVIKNSYVISSEQLPGNGQDSWHFSAAGYRIFGKRYAFKALQVMGKETQMDPEYQMNASLKKFFTPKSVDTLFVRKAGTSLGLMLTCTYVDGHTEKIKDATYTSTDFELKQGYIVKFGEAGTKGTVTATFTDFFGEVHEVVLTIQSEGTAAINTVNADQNDSQKAVFDLQGRKVTNEPSKKGIYIVNGKKVVR
jgi:hypothetical protein